MHRSFRVVSGQRVRSVSLFFLRALLIRTEAAAPAAAAPAAAPKAGLESVKLDAGRAELEDFLSDVKEDEAEKSTAEKPAEAGADPDAY